MIQKARERINAHGVNLCKSSTPGHKIIGTSVFKSDSNSTTISRRPIIEVPEGVLPDDCDIEQARSVLAGMVLEGDLLPDEIDALLSVYPVWEPDTWYEQGGLIRHNDQLYQINQEHTSQTHYPPDSEGVTALYSKTVPDNVIPVWVQPTGAHDSYQVGDFVQWPEGTVWECTAGDGSGNNSWEPGVYGWTLVEAE
jgi:hypothetical protein